MRMVLSVRYTLFFCKVRSTFMEMLRRFFALVLIVSVVGLGSMGCKETSEHPSNEHPSSEHPTDEHPTEDEPTDEHPTEEHPTDEHPTE